MSARPGDMVELKRDVGLRERPAGRRLGWISVKALHLVVAESKDDDGYCWLLVLGTHRLGWVHEGYVVRRWLLPRRSS